VVAFTVRPQFGAPRRFPLTRGKKENARRTIVCLQSNLTGTSKTQANQ
jgi:hypothetical protein